MQKTSIALKLIAIIIGVFCIPYGLLGFFGINPAGHHEELWVKLIGLYLSILGCIYIYPNSKLQKNNKQSIYYILTISPVVIVLIASIVSIYNEGFHYFLIVGGINTVVGVSICAIFAPLSLLLYGKNKK